MVDEIEHDIALCPQVTKTGEFFFEDDTFTVIKKNAMAICEEILRRNLKITFSVNARTDTADEELFRSLKKAGCRELLVGFESGDQGMLDRMQKKETVEDAQRFMKLANKTGLDVHGCFVFGLPGETKETIEKTLDFALNLGLHTVQFAGAVPFPGTDYFEYLPPRRPAQDRTMGFVVGWRRASRCSGLSRVEQGNRHGGGGSRTEELLLPAELHDKVSAANPELGGSVQEASRTKEFLILLDFGKTEKVNPPHPSISIVIPVYNCEDTVGKCLESLLQLEGNDYEIIMMNDGSTDRTLEICGSIPEIQTVTLENGGPSRARNKGIELARGEFIVFTDGDCVVDRNWLAELRKGFDAPDVAGVGGNQIEPR